MTPALITDPTLIFFVVLAIILLAPLLLNRLKIPHIIGMIIAGVAVGPFGFHVLDDDASFKIFGQVGLLYLMFLAAIEIDLYHLQRNLKRGSVFGLLTLAIPLVLGYFSATIFFGCDMVTSLLLASMYASHTLISYPVAVRFGITKAPAVLMAIVGTIVAVIGALITLATAVNVHQNGVFSVAQISFLLLKLAAFCVGITLVYRRLARAFLRKYTDRVTQFVFVLALVFFAAWLAKAIGLEGVLGAFFAGLVLNRFVPNTSPLMSRLEFVGNALFIPYFLIGIGMMIDVRVIASADTLRLAAVMLAVALVGKWLPAFITSKIYRMGRDSAQVMFGLTTAHTAVALAVVSVGYNFGLLDSSMLNATVLMILITCAIAPMATSGAAGRIRLKMLEETPEPDSDHPNNTLVPVNNPLTSVALMEIALTVHPREHNDGSLMALHVRTSNSAAARNNSDASLQLAKEASATVDLPVITIERFDSNVDAGLINTINERDVNCVIMGLHRRASLVDDSFFGAKMEHILESTNRMILICRLFNPINTLRRLVVVVPPQAEFESGFRLWVTTVGRLASKLGCRAIFLCSNEVSRLIVGILKRERIDLRLEFRPMEQWDDFVPMANRIADDDLLLAVSSRPGSISYTPEIKEMELFLHKYFTQANLIVLFPEQSGKNDDVMSFIDPTGAETINSPALPRRIAALFRPKTRKRL